LPELPGYEVFQYLDEETSAARSIRRRERVFARGIGQGLHRQGFRTWAGTLLAAMALREFEKFDSGRRRRKIW